MTKLLTTTYGKNLRWQNTNAKGLQETFRRKEMLRLFAKHITISLRDVLLHDITNIS